MKQAACYQCEQERNLIDTKWQRIMVCIVSGNVSLPDGTKLLPEPMFIKHQDGYFALTWGPFHGDWLLSILDAISIIVNRSYSCFFQGQWVEQCRY